MNTAAVPLRPSPSPTSRWTRSAPYKALRGLGALVKLVRDPDDLPQVFRIIEGFGDRSIERNLARLRRSPTVASVCSSTSPDIVPLLADRRALAALPAGSLGRAYLTFVEAEGITAEGLIAASEAGQLAVVNDAPDLAWQKQRMRDTHDLWHALTGYHGDVLGEAALLAFLYAQTEATAIGLIVAAGVFKLRTAEARRLIFDGYRRGKRAAWLPEVEWETLLARPLDEVRTLLHIDAPAVYAPLRTAELRAAQLLH